MNRRKFYTDQLVDSPDLDAAVTNIYNGVASLLTDVGITGIISGGDVTERATPSMSVDVSGPFIGYDQSGDRLYKSDPTVVDCSVDYLGSPTVPTGAGEKVWVSIWAVYTYTEEDAVVIGSSTYYRTWADSIEFRVVAGTPATGGSHTKPALPSDALLVADIELDYGHTTILTADIDETRKMTWAFTSADSITVDGSAFTKLSTSIDDVQEALDAIDVLLISRDGSGDIDQTLLPDGNTRNLGSAAKNWGEGHITDAMIYNTLKASADQKVLGTASERFTAHLYDATVYNSILAAAGGETIGDGTNQFAAHLSALTMYGNALPNATGVDLGSAAARFDAFLEAVTLYGTLALAAANSTTVVIDASEFMLDGTWELSGSTKIRATDASETILSLKGIPDGAQITQVSVRWQQSAAGGGAANFGLYKRAFETSARTQIGGTTNVGGYAANRTDSLTSLTETIDRSGYEYVLIVQGGVATANTDVYQVEVSYNYTNLLAAIQAS